MRKLKFGKLSKQQLIAVSEIARDNAQIIFASAVIPSIISADNWLSWIPAILGIIISVGLWILSVIIIK